MAHVSKESVAKLFPFRTKETILKKSIPSGRMLWDSFCSSPWNPLFLWNILKLGCHLYNKVRGKKAQWYNVAFYIFLFTMGKKVAIQNIMAKGGKTSGWRVQKSVFCHMLVEWLYAENWKSMMVGWKMTTRTWELNKMGSRQMYYWVGMLLRAVLFLFLEALFPHLLN